MPKFDTGVGVIQAKKVYKQHSVFLIILFSLFLSVPLCARGNQEIGLPKVDRLIKERNYNEAILELAAYMNENPEDFDGAQRRIKRIIDMRENYNKKAMELLLVLAEEPTNDKKKLEMIAFMETLEKNPNQATRDFIAGTKAAAQFTYYRARFDEIMNEANQLIDAREWARAPAVFNEGFSFYKTDFDEANDPETVSEVNRRLGNILSANASYVALQLPLETAVLEVRAALEAGDAPRIDTAFSSLAGVVEEYAKIRNRIAENGWFFEDSFIELQKTAEVVTENSFLPFALRFTLGRKTSNRFEGILGAMDSQYTVILGELDALTDQVLRSFWQSALSEAEAGRYDAMLQALDTSALIARSALRMDGPGRLFAYRDDTWGRRDQPKRTAELASVESVMRESSQYATLVRRFESLVSAGASPSGMTASPAGVRTYPDQTYASSQAKAAELDSIRAGIFESVRRAQGLASIGAYADDYSALLASLDEKVLGSRNALHEEMLRYLADSGGQILELRTGEYEGASAYLTGVQSTPDSPLLFYPAEALSAFNALRTGLISDLSSFNKVLTAQASLGTDIKVLEFYTAAIASLEERRSGLERLAGLTATGISRANSRILEAAVARQESERRYAQAQAALRRSDFPTARDNLQRSRDKASESLSIQESASFRLDTDRKLELLGAEITRIENESVVREVRALISSGKNFYYQGNFDQAEQVFIQAKTRWAVTNIEANAEVTNWLDIINIALSMKTGRTIPISEPLYPQLSQILSGANTLYSRGKELIESGKRAEGTAVLQEAKEKLQQLQLLYPLNQDAGQLTLLINQLIDPTQFRVFFRDKVESIRSNYRTERQTAYSDLLDLYQINPAYPGIRSLLTEIEYYLGIRIPPPDPKALARSAELTRLAQRTYDANRRTEFESALVQLDEAIKLNPDNSAAVALKDRVQTAIGGQSLAVLSAEDEAKYNRALQLLFSGAKYDALALVNELLQSPKSRNSSKVQDLKKRIESQL